MPINFDRLWDETDHDYCIAVRAWVDEVAAARQYINSLMAG